MRQAHLILITGLAGTGKSTLARAVAGHFGLPLISKDTIKEPLLDVIGAKDRAESRRLSDASFAVMFALTRECVRAGSDVVLEGNFRSGEHEAALRAALADTAHSAVAFPDRVRLAQILCRVAEPVRIARLAARAIDPSRHAGHRDAEIASERSRRSAEFLALPGERFVFDSHDSSSAAGGGLQLRALIESLRQSRSIGSRE